MFEFNSINNETIEGKIYLSEDNKQILPIYYEERYFEIFENYKSNKSEDVKRTKKKYIFNKLEYRFNVRGCNRWESIDIGRINKRIVVIKGQSQYDALRIGTDYRIEFFEKLGIEVDIVDLIGKDVYQNIDKKIINNIPDFIYSANCIGIDLKLVDGRNLYEVLKIPFIGTLGDHPVNQLGRIIDSPSKTLFTCLDKENIEYLKKYFPEKNIIVNNNVAYPSTNYKENIFRERNIDVLFVGTIINPKEVKDIWKNFDEITKLIINNIIDIAIKKRFLIDIDSQISNAFYEYNVKNDELSYRSTIHSLIEKYIRVYKRYELVRKIGESGLQVTCVGNIKEYEQLNKSGKLILKDKVDYSTLLKMMNNSKMVLNMTGHLYDGITERVLSSMINGAVSITEEDRFTQTNFQNGKNIILYNINNVIEKITYYLRNIDELEVIAFNGKYEAINKYDYRIFVSKIMRYKRSIL